MTGHAPDLPPGNFGCPPNPTVRLRVLVHVTACLYADVPNSTTVRFDAQGVKNCDCLQSSSLPSSGFPAVDRVKFGRFMRIIGGTAGGRTLKVPAGLGVRPTPDLVRQAIFNSLGAKVIDAKVLELFGGTGALSLECLSRGAVSALCVEKSAKHAGFIRSNLRAAGLSETSFQLRIQDAFVAVQQLALASMQFDLVLADPPYGEKNTGRKSGSFAQKLLEDKYLPPILASGGMLVLGHARRDQLTIPPGWTERKALKHGDSVFRMMVPAAIAPEEHA
jgi:16S rRNA (guanine966-N2)-methyltransferase